MKFNISHASVDSFSPRTCRTTRQGAAAPAHDLLVLSWEWRNGQQNGGFPKLGVPYYWVPIIRTIVFWGLYWGPLILGSYQMELSSCEGATTPFLQSLVATLNSQPDTPRDERNYAKSKSGSASHAPFKDEHPPA